MKAYLGWPVKLHAYPGEYHITLKYLGEVYDIEALGTEISKRLEGRSVAFPLSPLRAPVKWLAQRFGYKTYVLELLDFDPALQSAHAAVADLRKDDYPIWRPHITVPLPLWDFVSRKNILAKDAIESIGPLALYVKEDGKEYSERWVWL